jgi:hypothetical protein
MYLLEVCLAVYRIRFDRCAARIPVRGAYLSVLISEFKRVNKTEGFVNGATNREVINSDLVRDGNQLNNNSEIQET